MTRDFARLLRPRSIAVVGGGSWGGSVVEQCLKMGFDGPVWPVHPTRKSLGGVPCFASLDALPWAPDAVFVGVNRHLTVDVVRTLAAMGAGGAVCFASGFAEAEDDRAAGAALQDALVAAAGAMPVLGPNCYGFINYCDGALLWPDEHGGVRTERGVALLGQSSNMLINLTMQRRSVPLAYVIGAGNQAQVGLAELGVSVLEDPRVTAVGLHVEGMGDVRAWEVLAARARALGKPLVALKVGRSGAAQVAAQSHTASLAGGDAAARAFLARLGIASVDTLEAFLETLKLAHVDGVLPGRRVGSLSCSGGEASLIADMADRLRVDVRPLTEAECAGVKATLSDLVTVTNPLDYHTFIWGDAARMTDTFAAMIGCGFDLSIVIADWPRADRCDPSGWDCLIDAILAAEGRTGARVAVLASLPENLPEALAARFMAAGIAPMMGMEASLTAVAALADVAECWARPAPAPIALPEEGECAQMLDEVAAKAVLAEHGVPIPRGARADTVEEAGNAAAELGFPVVLKGLGVAHKTESGAVALGITDVDAARMAAAGMDAHAGFLIEEMVPDAVAELIVGVVRDPVCGLALTIGAGGVLTELLDDTATLLIPAPRHEVARALQGLKVARLLDGYRGKPPADMAALLDTIMAIQAASVALPGLAEMDVNPVIATPGRAIAVDALIRLG